THGLRGADVTLRILRLEVHRRDPGALDIFERTTAGLQRQGQGIINPRPDDNTLTQIRLEELGQMIEQLLLAQKISRGDDQTRVIHALEERILPDLFRIKLGYGRWRLLLGRGLELLVSTCLLGRLPVVGGHEVLQAVESTVFVRATREGTVSSPRTSSHAGTTGSHFPAQVRMEA